MTKLSYDQRILNQLSAYASKPNQCLIICGNQGSGKSTLLKETAASILHINLDKLIDYPYKLLVEANDKRIITIDQIKQIKHFLSLQVPLSGYNGINRIILIDDADKMNSVSQNALLKDIEEPPIGTIFIMTVVNLNKILTTIKSRANIINLNPFNDQDIENFLADKSISQPKIKQYVNLSNKSIKKAIDLINSEQDDKTLEAYTIAKKIITSNRYDRLIQVNNLSKDRDLAYTVIQTIQTMADNALAQNNNKQSNQWLNMLKVCYQTLDYLDNRVNLKLAITYLMNNL